MKRFLERLRIRGSIGEELDAHLGDKVAALMESVGFKNVHKKPSTDAR